MFIRRFFRVRPSLVFVTGCLSLTGAACDAPLSTDEAPSAVATPTPEPPAPSYAPAEPNPEAEVQPTPPAPTAGPLFTTFSPSRVVERQSLRVSLPFDPVALGLAEYQFRATFVATYGDSRLDGRVTVVPGGLDVEVPLGASDGDLCIGADWQDEATCAGHLTILEGPVIEDVTAHGVPGGCELRVRGEAFLSDAVLYVVRDNGYVALDVADHDDTLLVAFLPDGFTMQSHATVFVHVPSVGRCGRSSNHWEVALAR